MNYFIEFDKTTFKEFRSATQPILDAIPYASSLPDAILLFTTAYQEEYENYEKLLKQAISKNYPKFKITKEITLFYILMTLRTRYPHFFPAPTLCLNLSYALNGELRRQECSKISIKNMELLPVALITANIASEIHIENIDSTALAVKDFLTNFSLERSTIEWNFSKKKIKKEEYIALTQFPLPHTTIQKELFTELQNYSASIAFTSWNFLASQEHFQMRSFLAYQEIISQVIQLPLPTREGNKVYPAALVLHKEAFILQMLDLHSLSYKYLSQLTEEVAKELRDLLPDTEDITHAYRKQIFAQIINNEPLLNDADSALNAAYKEKLKKHISLFMAVQVLHEERSLKLSPLQHITWRNSPLQAKVTTKLGELAEVMRCQETRISIKDRHLSDDEYKETVYADITLKDIDSLTGMVIFDNTDKVQMMLDESKKKKFVLQENDIVLAHKGSKATIGRVGFVEPSIDEKSMVYFNSRPCTPGTSLLIIRPHAEKIDPVWLFYYLSEKKMQDMILSKATGSSILSVNLKTVRELPIVLPTEKELEKENSLHRSIKSSLASILFSRRAIEEAIIMNNTIYGMPEEYSV